MLKTYLYVPHQLNEKITNTAKSQGKTKAEVIRQALSKGLEIAEKEKVGGAESLLMLAEIGKKFKLRGKHNSSRMDELLWGKDWSKDE